MLQLTAFKPQSYFKYTSACTRMSDRPQFYRNTLELPQINQPTLHQALTDLSTAVHNGVKIIETGDRARGQYDGRGIFSGDLGIALTYLRLAHQAPSLEESGESIPNFYALSVVRIPEHGPDLPLQVGGLSPLPSKSPIAAVAVRILHKSATDIAGTISDADIVCLGDAVKLALSHGATSFYHGHDLGADEVLFGRTGLLWVLLNIRAKADTFPSAQRELLRPVLDNIPDLLRRIVDSGREGSAHYVKKHGEKDALPLMWPWMPGHYGIGWAHGLTGIIPVLLASHPEEVKPYLSEIGRTITALCNICIEHDGHLPTTIPARHSNSCREAPLVQICHGAPAILGLLGASMKNTELLLNHWTPAWETAARLATERVWDEGLLSKGGSLCHGITGNAWPLLMLHDVFEYSRDALSRARENYRSRQEQGEKDVIPEILNADFFLARALAMILHARETQPYNDAKSPTTASNDYRMPDHPYSLFEGLAGMLCAWAETVAVLRARLRKMEVGETEGGLAQDEAFKKYTQQQLGFPCLGGNGAVGVL